MLIHSPYSVTTGVPSKLSTHDQVLEGQRSRTADRLFDTPRPKEGDNTVQFTGPSTSPEMR